MAGEAKDDGVELVVADPWNLAGGRYIGHVISAAMDIDGKSDAILIRFCGPLAIDGTNWEYFVAVPRQRVMSIRFPNDVAIDCNLIGVPAARVGETANLFDLGWWRGGGALIGSIRRIASDG